MTGKDFCYWLQGWFEIAKPETISGKQFSMIEKHLELYRKYRNTNLDKLNKTDIFCSWLSGVIDCTNATTINLELVSERLSDIFEHEIDLSYTSDTQLMDEMNHIHNDDGTTNIRC